MKKFNLTILSILLTVGLHAQWTRTNVDVVDTGIEAFCEHNGSLFASIYVKGLVKYDNTSNQWIEVADNLPPTGNSAHIANLASSGNYLYAYVNDQFTASTTIYRSSDNGLTFETDTIGHPRYGPFPTSTAGYPVNVHDVYVLDGRIYNVLGGAGYSKLPSDNAWSVITDPNVKFAESFAAYNNTWYATYGNTFFTSTDAGVTWVAAANAGLATGFTSTYLNVNPASGRIYVRNTPGPFDVQKVFYSDDEGAVWDSLHINQFLGSSWMGGVTQSLRGMISNGDDITAMLTNSSTNSTIDVIKSTDGGLSFAPDTLGLPFDQFGAIAFVEFIYFNDQLWFAPNSADIYVQDAGGLDVKNLSQTSAKIFPNPFSSAFTITNDYVIKEVRVMDLLGKTIYVEETNSKEIVVDLANEPAGIYFVDIVSNDGEQTVKVVKH